MDSKQQQVVAVVRMLLHRDPRVNGRFPRLREQIHQARLGNPSTSMRQLLAKLGQTAFIGTLRARDSAGLAVLEPGATIAYIPACTVQTFPRTLTDARGRHLANHAVVESVEPYPLEPDDHSQDPAAWLVTGEHVTWGQAIAVVTPDEPLQWQYAMEHETDTGVLKPPVELPPDPLVTALKQTHAAVQLL